MQNSRSLGRVSAKCFLPGGHRVARVAIELHKSFVSDFLYRKWTRGSIKATHTHTHTCMYVYIYTHTFSLFISSCLAPHPSVLLLFHPPLLSRAARQRRSGTDLAHNRSGAHGHVSCDPSCMAMNINQILASCGRPPPPCVWQWPRRTRNYTSNNNNNNNMMNKKAGHLEHTHTRHTQKNEELFSQKWRISFFLLLHLCFSQAPYSTSCAYEPRLKQQQQQQQQQQRPTHTHIERKEKKVL